jgi:uncharacterized repeat protein (TIGR01451 family)
MSLLGAARVGAIAMALVVAGRAVSAQTYEISWWTVDAGGFVGAATPGNYQFSTTAGQPDAGGPFVGSVFVVHSGFWGLVAGGAGGPQADLSATITDGQATAVPGLPVTYTMTVSNAGPNAAAGVWIFNITAPISLLDVTWTCTASSGSSCPASGNGMPNHLVDLAIGGVLTYTLTGTHQVSAFGSFSSTVTATVPSGMTDPDLANNSATDTDQLTRHADLSIAMADSPDPVGPGLIYTYTIGVTNGGPSYSSGSTITDPLPAGVTFMGYTGVAACSHASGTVTCDMDPSDVGETQTVTIRAQLLPATTGVVSNVATVLGDDTDPVAANNVDTEITTVGMKAQAELTHGGRVTADLASTNGAPDADFYRIRQTPHSSYEIVIDGGSGDTGTHGRPELLLLAADGQTEVASGQPIGTGSSVSLRWINDTTSTIDVEQVRVRSTGCLFNCGPDDQYRLRLWDTTGFIPRFNNSGSQTTVVILQNTTPAFVFVRIYFWDPAGALLFRQSVQMAPRTLYIMPTGGFPELENRSGSITVASDAPFGTLVGKAVALEPSSGFSFDSTMATRPR